MTADVYCGIAAIVQASHCNEVIFGCCSLTKDKLQSFGLGFKDKDVSVSMPILIHL